MHWGLGRHLGGVIGAVAPPDISPVRVVARILDPTTSLAIKPFIF